MYFNPNRHAGKFAIVTGGARGIGGAAAMRLAAEGAIVTIADINEAAADETVKAITAAGGKAAFVACNITSEDAVRALVEGVVARHGRLDILANVAALSLGNKASVDEVTLENFRQIISINLEGTFLCSKYAVRAMKKQKYGRIVNVSSTNSVIPTTFGNTAYTASKGAINAMTRQWVLELAAFGITVNVVAPGPTRTPLFDSMGPQLLADRLKIIPAGRVGETEDQAAAIAFLASDDASYINGQVLVVDGGLTVVNHAAKR